MASPSTVLSQGFGSWGNVHLLPTLGFGIGASAAMNLILTTTTAYGDTVTATSYGDTVTTSAGLLNDVTQGGGVG